MKSNDSLLLDLDLALGSRVNQQDKVVIMRFELVTAGLSQSWRAKLMQGNISGILNSGTFFNSTLLLIPLLSHEHFSLFRVRNMQSALNCLENGKFFTRRKYLSNI